MKTRRAKTEALSRFLSGDASALKALNAHKFPRDPVTGEYAYERMTDEQLTQLIDECRRHMTPDELARCHPNSFRNVKDLTDDELRELIEWDRARVQARLEEFQNSEAKIHETNR